MARRVREAATQEADLFLQVFHLGLELVHLLVVALDLIVLVRHRFHLRRWVSIVPLAPRDSSELYLYLFPTYGTSRRSSNAHSKVVLTLGSDTSLRIAPDGLFWVRSNPSGQAACYGKEPGVAHHAVIGSNAP